MKILINKKEIIIALIIILFATLLRSKDFISGDFNYFLDQSRDLLLTREIVVNKDITLIGGRSGLGGIFHGPLWLYMIVPFFIISQGNPFYTLVPLYVLLNTTLVALSFLVGKKLYGTFAATIFAVCIASSGILIDLSFNFSNSNNMPIVFLVYLFSAIQVLRGKDIYVAALFLLVGLGFQFESAFAIFLIPLSLLVFILNRKLPRFKYTIIGLILFFVATSTFIVFELRHNFLMTHSAIQLLTNKVEPMKDYNEYSSILFRIKDRALLLMYYFKLPFYHNTFAQIVFISMTLLFIYRTVLYKLTFKKEIAFLVLTPIFFFALYIFYPFPLWEHYYASLTISSALLFSVILHEISSMIKYKSQFYTAIFILILLPPLVWIFNHYIGKDRLRTVSGTYKNQYQIVDFIFQDAANNQTIQYFVYDPGLLTYNMDYLMWYRGKVSDKQIASTKDKGDVYLIINQPPVWNKGGPEYWKKNVIKTTSKAMYIKKFPNSSTVVQKISVSGNEESVDSGYFQNLIFR